MGVAEAALFCFLMDVLQTLRADFSAAVIVLQTLRADSSAAVTVVQALAPTPLPL
jgi:hypothetical protein